ncbi:MAG: amidohydrolase [Mesorhizobium sp.]|uniref:amidohydrolase family protein n=1 Tax=Mesorhizobium sp. TaxID=1871066 RepID=UPI000FE85D0E|nr:amidohydrolase family protein [Mesorhizobium sp.]RWI57054.1 MAG: amidohydrolase [Mesorhizobium sp.]
MSEDGRKPVVKRNGPGRIDVHCHFIPDFYRDALLAAGISKPDGIGRIPDWSEDAGLAALNDIGVHHAYLSISSPGVNFSDPAANRILARRVNEEGARLHRAHPDRISYFASLPFGAVGEALEEAIRAFDELDAAGVVLTSNTGGIYLGDEKLAPLLSELDKRKAILFVHPTSPHTACSCCAGHDVSLGYPRPMIEFLFETTRSVVDFVLSGHAARYRNIRLIVPHAGAVLPLVASRVDLLGKVFGHTRDDHIMHDALKTMYFDLAGMPLPDMLPALLKVADPGKLLFGSDFPFTPLVECTRNALALDDALGELGLASQTMRDNPSVLFGRCY